MAKIFVGKCPRCDSSVYQKEGEKVARCHFCGTIINTMQGEDKPVKTGAKEIKDTTRGKKANNDKLMVALVVMLGILFLGLAVMVGIISATYARQNLEARNENPADSIGSNFLKESDELNEDLQSDPGEISNDVLKGEAETILDEDTPMAATPGVSLKDKVAAVFDEIEPRTDASQYGDLTENECKAVEDVMECLSASSFSRSIILELLTSGDNPRYTYAEADNALNYMEENGYVDWYTQAIITGGDYLDLHSYSKDELINLLTDDSVGFTGKQAEFAAESLGVK